MSSISKVELSLSVGKGESADDEEEMEPLSPGHTRPLVLDGSGYPPSYPTDKKGKGNGKNLKGKSQKGSGKKGGTDDDDRNPVSINMMGTEGIGSVCSIDFRYLTQGYMGGAENVQKTLSQRMELLDQYMGDFTKMPFDPANLDAWLALSLPRPSCYPGGPWVDPNQNLQAQLPIQVLLGLRGSARMYQTQYCGRFREANEVAAWWQAKDKRKANTPEFEWVDHVCMVMSVPWVFELREMNRVDLNYKAVFLDSDSAGSKRWAGMDYYIDERAKSVSESQLLPLAPIIPTLWTAFPNYVKEENSLDILRGFENFRWLPDRTTDPDPAAFLNAIRSTDGYQLFSHRYFIAMAATEEGILKSFLHWMDSIKQEKEADVPFGFRCEKEIFGRAKYELTLNLPSAFLKQLDNWNLEGIHKGLENLNHRWKDKDRGAGTLLAILAITDYVRLSKRNRDYARKNGAEGDPSFHYLFIPAANRERWLNHFANMRKLQSHDYCRGREKDVGPSPFGAWRIFGAGNSFTRWKPGPKADKLIGCLLENTGHSSHRDSELIFDWRNAAGVAVKNMGQGNATLTPAPLMAHTNCPLGNAMLSQGGLKAAEENYGRASYGWLKWAFAGIDESWVENVLFKGDHLFQGSAHIQGVPEPV